jgi:hypothetical protein
MSASKRTDFVLVSPWRGFSLGIQEGLKSSANTNPALSRASLRFMCSFSVIDWGLT